MVIKTAFGSGSYCNVWDQGPISLLFPDSLASLILSFSFTNYSLTFNVKSIYGLFNDCSFWLIRLLLLFSLICNLCDFFCDAIKFNSTNNVKM